ncbi:MAG TPA: CBS domain-containing protein, partial [candidate division WOR-3 bacterium]|nr:CBS domain-containing protein [candidate division WOR-3 bacterium]
MEGLRKILVNNKVSIKEAMRVIDQGSIKMAVVVNNTGQLCGIVTDGDIRRGILKGISIDENVSVVMNKHPVYVYEGTPRGEIVKLLKDKKILGLPIVDNRKIVKDFILLSGGTEISHFSQRPRIRKHIDRVLV